MEKTTIYAGGIRTFEKHKNAPDFVLGAVIISLKEFGQWVKENPQYLTDYKGDDQLRLQLLRKKDGGISLTVDNYKPVKKEEPKTETPFTNEIDQDLPF